jgi:TolA-binding protein
MPLTAEGPLAALRPARPPPTLVNLGREEINPDAMDDVIMRLFKELNKQLAQMEAVKADQLSVTDRERHARILASLERTMERLATLEAGRAAARRSKASVKSADKRDLLLRKILIHAQAEIVEERSECADG